MPPIQTFANHTRFHPPFHFVLGPLLIANLIVQIVLCIHLFPSRPFLALWIVVMAVVLIGILGFVRGYALSNQDRIIRIEETTRLAKLAPNFGASALSTKQLVALRFASDAELPTLASRTLAENLDPKTIKQSIAVWRPDLQRI